VLAYHIPILLTGLPCDPPFAQGFTYALDKGGIHGVVNGTAISPCVTLTDKAIGVAVIIDSLPVT
jgi:hypothetical protein